MAHSSIRTRIVRDRKRAGVFACLAILLIAAVFTVFLYVASFVTQYLGRFYFNVVASGTVFFCAVVARWNFEFVRARLIRQRIQAMWLRRFQAEGGRAFRTSRVVDRLARYGISTLTLQDRDVRLSLEQRHQRLAPILWALSIPLTTGLALVSFSLWQAAFRSTSAGGFRELGALFAAFEGLLFVAVILAGAMSIASIAGPIETFFFRHRDDYAKLPRLVRRVTAGRRQRGAVVLRISDDHWRDAVTTALRAVDVAIIDVSSVTDHIAWEIHEAANACGAANLVFICKKNPERLSPRAAQIIRDVCRLRSADIVFYPEFRHERRRGREFAVALREAIYTTVDWRSG